MDKYRQRRIIFCCLFCSYSQSIVPSVSSSRMPSNHGWPFFPFCQYHSAEWIPQAWTQATQCKDDPSEWAIIMARVTRCPLMPRLGLHATLHRPTATRGSSKNKWINDSPLRGGMSPCPPPSIYRHACLVLSLSSPLLLATFSLYILFIIGDAFCSCFHQSAFS